MTIYFTNCCRHIVILNIDNNEPVSLQPFESKPITRNDSDVIKVLVKRDCKSKKKIVHISFGDRDRISFFWCF